MPRGRCVQVLTPMTSGSLLDLSAYEAVGPFMDELFIDQVDNEFCLRLRAAGFSVLEAGEATLQSPSGRRALSPFPRADVQHQPPTGEALLHHQEPLPCRADVSEQLP